MPAYNLNRSLLVTIRNKDLTYKLVGGYKNTIEIGPIAAAYIQRRSLRNSVEKYLTEFSRSESKRAWLLGYDEGEFRREGGASNAIFTTWQISFEYIRSKRASAYDLGSNSSDNEIYNDEIYNDKTDNRFEDNITMLTNYYLVTISESGDTFEMYGLVQLSTRTWLKACRREEEFKHQFRRHRQRYYTIVDSI
ncbi:hypothetical protein QBC32DRAFT_374807 [Pseudoneurospora amorphoporcata]|uniref:Uncharacterized protein n=1 Tax=Pseudoneurospora amorphoporcata TaxID=241081 RepID=A0AAN6NKS5_9PEZI|nr:hypothetical protein QBC32DRAFT_374807 [Pseudoneurospora amorphoporcata]